MALIRKPNVYCHMLATEYTDANGGPRLTAGQVQTTIYETLTAATRDLRGFVKALHEGGHSNISDFTSDSLQSAVYWTDKWTGTRMKRWVADLPFFTGD